MEKTASDLQDTYCVFTVLIGNYEVLNDQPALGNSHLRRICFTDNPDLRSDTWEIRLVDPILPLDPIRSQRLIKARPAGFLPEFDGSLYIDNSVVLKTTPEELLTSCARKGQSTFFLHSFRESLQEEFFEVIDTGLDDSARVFEQFNHYKMPEVSALDEPVLWTGILIRDHTAPSFDLFSEIWATHILRYSRRDQLSINVALKQSALSHQRVKLDNYDSIWHKWPVARNKNFNLRRNGGGLLDTEFRLETVRLKKENEQLKQECSHLLQQFEKQVEINHQNALAAQQRVEDLGKQINELTDSFIQSTSWRVTRPLRWISQRLKR